MIRLVPLLWLTLFVAVLLLGALLDAGAAGAETPAARRGWVSWYGLPATDIFEGQPAAWGEHYSSDIDNWAASALLPMSTVPIYTHLERLLVIAGPLPRLDEPMSWWTPMAIVTIRDTCPGCGKTWPTPWLDLSPRTFRRLAPLQQGMIRVWIVPLP